MRKYIIGILIGFTLSFAVSAHAEIVSVVGKTIEGVLPVKVSGQQLGESAVVVEGTSYLPVRAIGEALNMDVSFDANSGIELQPKGESPVIVTDRDESMRKLQLYDLRKQEEELTNQIADLHGTISSYEVGHEKEKDEAYFEATKKREALIVERDGVNKQLEEIMNQQKALTEQKMEELRQQLNQ